MTPERWQRVEEVFAEALEVGEGERSHVLRRHCEGDEELRREVESLLAADRRGQHAGFLDESVMEATGPSSAADAGRRVGAYRLVEPIGAGGMGTVWLAERTDGQFEQRVAVKLMRAELNTPDLERRFRDERQHLARLEHPNICRLLDGGVDDAGRPYLVMEQVHGVPIDAWCDARRLTIERRLALFLDVCAAVQHAHQNLIVHRDLKPSNILVTDDGIVKLLDFGIARAIHGEGRGDETLTSSGQRQYTPAYASPEQVRGGTISTASDVYSLGVILYELLTGARPYRVSSMSAAEVEAVVCGTRPPTPTDAVRRGEPPSSDARAATPDGIAAARSTTTARLSKTLRGDLGAIVMTALRKEAARRYASAAALGADIRHWLAREPVTARPDSWSYRTRLFVSRHRWGVASASVVATLVLTASIVVSVLAVQLASALDEAAAKRAQAELEMRRTMSASFMHTSMLLSLASSNESTKAALLADVRRRADRLDRPPVPISPFAEISSREALGRVASALDAHEIALRQFTRIIELAEGRAEEDIAYASALSLAGISHFRLGEHEQAIERFRAARALDVNPEMHDQDVLLCEALLMLGRPDEAADAIRGRPLPAPPFDQPVRQAIQALEARYGATLPLN
jgi:serine/threonine protein kinase